jgi:uncharacterized protein YjgD (DUF1641 family)
MANPIAFTPKAVDPKFELQRRLATAPNEHAEALLVAYELLDEAHRQGILDLLHGAIGAKDSLLGTIADYSGQPISVNALRNLLALGKLLGTLDPEPISTFSKVMTSAMEKHREEAEPPTLWRLFKRLLEPDMRRGLSFVTLMLSALGRASNADAGTISK